MYHYHLTIRMSPGKLNVYISWLASHGANTSYCPSELQSYRCHLTTLSKWESVVPPKNLIFSLSDC